MKYVKKYHIFRSLDRSIAYAYFSYFTFHHLHLTCIAREEI